MHLVIMQPIQQVVPSLRAKLRRLWWWCQTRGFLSTLNWAWCQSVPRITGIPVLSDGRVTPLVWIGPQHSRLGKWRLRLAGIRHTVSLRAEFNDADHHLTLETYCYLPTEDNAAPSLGDLLQGVAFVQRAVDEGEKVYIHCKRGHGRAPTLAAAYLISGGLAVSEALALVQRARPSIGLTGPQRTQLDAFAHLCSAIHGKD